MISRRKFIKLGAIAAAQLVLPVALSRPQTPDKTVVQASGPERPAAPPHPRLDPLLIPRYQDPLVIPPAMPKHSEIAGTSGAPIDYYEIGMTQFSQQILPAGGATQFNPTTVWSYYAIGHPETKHYPAYTIEARASRSLRVKWVNQLVDAGNNFLPHIVPVDPTLHWANPAGPRDSRPTFTTQPFTYDGPVPMVTHVHGTHVEEESDGFSEAWYLPAAANIPPDYFQVGSRYDEFKAKFFARYGVTWEPGSAVFQYNNEQRAGTLWYHDHAIGMTRCNVYAGPAGFYMVRGGAADLAPGVLPGPAPQVGDAPGTKYHEIPIAIQDRTFYADGSLWFPDSRSHFDGYAGPYIPATDVSPVWNPEFFGDTMVVNGKTWPVLHVEPRRYRLRFLNGCNARFLILKMTTEEPGLAQGAQPPYTTALPFGVIGTEGGFLPNKVSLDTLLMAPAERFDTIVDFTGVTAGTAIYLVNLGPDEPYGGGTAPIDFNFANPATTGQVMKFVVDLPITDPDTSTPFASLTLPAIVPLGPAKRSRQVSLNEKTSLFAGDMPVSASLGGVQIMNQMPTAMPMMWADPVTEMPILNEEEIWEIYNFTMDAHPIHLHQVMFEVINREPFMVPGPVRPCESWETGYKDTVTSYPGEITRLKARFDHMGLYVWHCHIVDHEDNEMMRPLRVVRRYHLPIISK